MTLSAIRPVDIQSHLYTAFLEGHTADIVLRITGGRWRALYRLHRVVLIQADFFRSLFTAGFLESSHSRHGGAEEIHITFDDSNITRAAFEICISRLYGGGPPLHTFDSLIPTTAQPLSPSFTSSLDGEVIPDGHHPATPRFLLSVLATAIYLSIPTVASQALSLIFKTIGPHTVMPYLDFALGKSIDSSRPIFQDPEAAVGLEHVAVVLEDESTTDFNTAEEMSSDLSKLDLRRRESSDVGSDSTSSDDDLSDTNGSFHHYGPISDKIGEACSCWLARWAKDMLSFEMEQIVSPVRDYKLSSGPTQGPVIWRRGGLDPAWITAIVSADALFVKDERERYDLARSIVDLRRREGIIEDEEQEWTKMFNEAIYYDNMVVEDIIAISHDKSPVTDRAFVPISTLQSALWNHSVLRQHITSKPRSPTISQTSSSLVPLSPSMPKDRELGILASTGELLSSSENDSQTLGVGQKLFYPIPGDSSWRMGDNGEEGSDPSSGNPLSMDDLFTFSHSPCVASARQSSNRTGTRKVATDKDTDICSTEATFFGLKRERFTAAECASHDPNGTRRWTAFPPCRFGVEFWDIDALKEKSRLHSQTVWCAGSLFNIYLQVVKKKGQTQLGIYLYRQSAVEAIPPASAPSPLMADQRLLAGENVDLSLMMDRPNIIRGFSYPSIGASPPRHSTALVHSPTLESRLASQAGSPPSTPVLQSANLIPSSSTTVPYTRNPIPPQQPYRDPRASISAYFMISCASATGSSQMRFTSAPDLFSVGQSWGWKTSSLRTEEYMEVGDNSTPVENRMAISSLRATVVLGLI